MKIEKFKQWYQVKSKDGFTITQFLTEQEARLFIAGSTNLPVADQHIGERLSHRRKGYTTRKVNIYP